MEDIPNIHEKVLVSALLSESTGKSSETLDAFSGWLLAGFAASVTLLLSNLSSLESYLSCAALHEFLMLFVAVVILGIAEKMLAVIVAGATAGAAIGRELGPKAAENETPLDINVVLTEMEKSVIWPMRWFVKRSYAKAKAGNILSAPRAFAKCVQIQGLLTLLQAVFVVLAICAVSNAIVF